MIHLVLFHCSLTAEDVNREHVVLTKIDFRCQHQRHITGSANRGARGTTAMSGANPKHCIPRAALKGLKGFVPVTHVNALTSYVVL